MKKLAQCSLFFCFLLMTNMALASFNKHSWPKWEVYSPLSQKVISHQEWQAFLTKYVITNEEGINLVDYSHITEADLKALKQYIDRLSKINLKDFNRDEQLAFWINLYNALTVQTVTRYYPVISIQDINISPGLFSIGPWGAHLITIEGTRLSLEEIQNRIIRPIWNDPRTHYAVNNGTIGAANLSKEAYQGSVINTQLNNAALEYINSLRGIQVIEGKLIVSQLYNWYLDDFGGNEQDLIFHLSQYAKEPLKRNLQPIHNINGYIYNWHLNSTSPSTS